MYMNLNMHTLNIVHTMYIILYISFQEAEAPEWLDYV